MAKGDKVKLDNPEWCKRCGVCVKVCPTDVLALGQDRVEVVAYDKCIGCENCELSCPDFVLKVVAENE
ncbi:MAG: 4Fe-4S binding protein [Halanaerobiales bacterium]